MTCTADFDLVFKPTEEGGSTGEWILFIMEPGGQPSDDHALCRWDVKPFREEVDTIIGAVGCALEWR